VLQIAHRICFCLSRKAACRVGLADDDWPFSQFVIDQGIIVKPWEAWALKPALWTAILGGESRKPVILPEC
jgi:hypothetical protein